MDPSLEQAMRALIDRQQIWAVLQRYGRGLDRMDREMTRSCYFDDAVDDHGPFVGAVEDFIDWADDGSRGFTCHHHGLMNHTCELAGDDAYTETYYLFLGVAPAAPHLLSMGRYVDHFQRRNGEWRIANRVTVIEKNFALEDSTLPANNFIAEMTPPEQRATRDRNDVSYARPPLPRRPSVQPVEHQIMTSNEQDRA